MGIKSARRCCAALITAVLAASCTASPPQADADLPKLGLMTTLPIYWQSGTALADLDAEADGAHWALEALGQDYAVEPLDVLTPAILADLDVLMLAQPRALTGAENVALDAWVRSGGRALIFADPMLVGPSDFAPGDPRRPLDTSLLSPILARWGLVQRFDPSPQAELRTVPIAGLDVAIAHGGTFSLRPPAGGAPSACSLLAERVLAQCAVEGGRVVVFGDATILEDRLGGKQSPVALEALVGMARELQDSEPG